MVATSSGLGTEDSIVSRIDLVRVVEIMDADKDWPELVAKSNKLVGAKVEVALVLCMAFERYFSSTRELMSTSGSPFADFVEG